MSKKQQSKKKELRNLSGNVSVGKETSETKNTSEMPERHKKYIATGIVTVVVLVVVLSFHLVPTHAVSITDLPLRNVNIALKWVHQSQFAGNYVAAEKGFYAARGLNATLLPYNFKDSPINLVVSGKATFGLASAGEILLARSKGIPVKAVAVIYQIDPVCAFSLKSSNITGPKDFVGKRVGVERGSNVEFEYIAMMENLHINRSALKEIDVGYNSSELINGDVDVFTGYVINEPYYAIAKSLDLNIIMVEDYGINTYADVLFTTDDLINTNPELVNGFVQATLDGWQYSLEHEDEAADIVMHYAKNEDLAHEQYALKTSLPLINTGDVALGSMTEDGWHGVEQSVLLQKLLVNPVNISDCYTTQFIDERHK